MTKLNTDIKFHYQTKIKFEPISTYKIDDETQRPRSLKNKSNRSVFYSKNKRNFERGHLEEQRRHRTSLFNTSLHTEAWFAVSHSALEHCCRSSWWEGWSFVEFHMPWVCTRLSRWMLSKGFSKSTIASAIQCIIRWWSMHPRLFENLLAPVWVAGPRLQRSAWWWARLGSCWGQTEEWLLSSRYSCAGLL